MTLESEGRKVGQRFAWLDALRLLCAVSVVLFHYGYVAPIANETVPLSYAFAPAVTIYGRLGVQVFFVISGFVISISSEGRKWNDFLWARAIRLYPAYWLAIVLTTLVLAVTASPHSPTLVQMLANLTMLQGFIGIPHVDEVYHTLAIELRFYIIVALLRFFGVRVSSIAVMASWLAICALCLHLPFVVGKIVISDWAPCFLSGMIIRSLLDRRQMLVKYGLLIAALGLELTLALSNNKHGPYDPAILCAVLIAGTLMVLACAFAPNPRSIGFFSILGAMTYPLYLIHAQIGWALMHLLADRMPKALGIWPMVAFMLLAAFVISRYPEPWLSRSLKAIPDRLRLRRVPARPATETG